MNTVFLTLWCTTLRIASTILHAHQRARLTSATIRLKDSKLGMQIQLSWTEPPLWGLDVRHSTGDEGICTRFSVNRVYK